MEQPGTESADADRSGTAQDLIFSQSRHQSSSIIKWIQFDSYPRELAPALQAYDAVLWRRKTLAVAADLGSETLDSMPGLKFLHQDFSSFLEKHFKDLVVYLPAEAPAIKDSIQEAIGSDEPALIYEPARLGKSVHIDEPSQADKPFKPKS